MNTEGPTTARADGNPPPEPDLTERYEIRVSGRLDSRWGSWFDGLSVISEPAGTTTISGPVVDQAALHGLLRKLRDLGLTLLSLTRTDPCDSVEHSISPINPNRTTNPGATS